MKKTYLIIGVIVILVLVISLFLLTKSENKIKAKCCEECKEASSTDVRAVDVLQLPCLDYKDYPKLDETGKPTEEKTLSVECVEYFEENLIKVGEC